MQQKYTNKYKNWIEFPLDAIAVLASCSNIIVRENSCGNGFMFCGRKAALVLKIYHDFGAMNICHWEIILECNYMSSNLFVMYNITGFWF